MRSARLSNDDISRIFSAASQPFSQSVAGWNYSDVAVVGEFRLFSVGYIAACKTSRGFFRWRLSGGPALHLRSFVPGVLESSGSLRSVCSSRLIRWLNSEMASATERRGVVAGQNNSIFWNTEPRHEFLKLSASQHIQQFVGAGKSRKVVVVTWSVKVIDLLMGKRT